MNLAEKLDRIEGEGRKGGKTKGIKQRRGGGGPVSTDTGSVGGNKYSEI